MTLLRILSWWIEILEFRRWPWNFRVRSLQHHNWTQNNQAQRNHPGLWNSSPTPKASCSNVQVANIMWDLPSSGFLFCSRLLCYHTECHCGLSKCHKMPKSRVSQTLHFPRCSDLLVAIFLLDNCRDENIRSGSLISDHSGHSTCQSWKLMNELQWVSEKLTHQPEHEAALQKSPSSPHTQRWKPHNRTNCKNLKPKPSKDQNPQNKDLFSA